MICPTDIRDAHWRGAVYAALQLHGPCTARELAARAGLDILTVRPRVTELEQLGFIECTGGTTEGTYRALTLAESMQRHAAAQALARGDGVQLGLHL